MNYTGGHYCHAELFQHSWKVYYPFCVTHIYLNASEAAEGASIGVTVLTLHTSSTALIHGPLYSP